jgi:hypothetical protein
LCDIQKNQMGCSVRRNCAYAGGSSAMSADDSSPLITRRRGGKIEPYTIIIMLPVVYIYTYIYIYVYIALKVSLYAAMHIYSGRLSSCFVGLFLVASFRRPCDGLACNVMWPPPPRHVLPFPCCYTPLMFAAIFHGPV